MIESTTNITATIAYRLCLSSEFIRISSDRGIIISTEGIRHLHGVLYLDVLELCASREYSFLALEAHLRNTHNSTHTWHALSILVEKGILENKDGLDENSYSNIQDFVNHLHLHWNACNKNDIPLVSVLPNLFCDDAERAYTKAKTEKRNWLPIVVGGAIPTLGPVFTGDGPCFDCLKFRLKENHSVLTWFEQQGITNGANAPCIETSKMKEYGASVQQFAKNWSPESSLHNKLIVLSIKDTILHTVAKRPECKTCGDPLLVSKQMKAPVYLEESNLILDYTVAYRSSTPGNTWKRLEKLVSPVSGILGNLHAIEKVNSSKFSVFSANFSVIPDNKNPNAKEFKLPAFGKGRSLEAAKVSATCEAIERASARYRGDEPILQQSYEQLGTQAVHPSAIQHFSEIQYQYPEYTLHQGPTPKPISDNEMIDWLPAWSLLHNERRYVPADAVLLGRPHNSNRRVAIFESNGLSAGNTKEEAILQGFLELIERDAVAIWWYNKLKRPPLNSEIMSDDPWFLQTVKNLKEEHIDTHFLDLTIDTGIPVVAAIGKSAHGWLAGYGCHFDARIAASRALSELIQIFALMDPVQAPEAHSNTAYLLPHKDAQIISQDTRFSSIHKNTNSFIKLGVCILGEMGIDTITVNCTRPDIALPVMKVMAPGLRALRPRFAEGRLYDVPVKYGLLSKAKSTQELNALWLTA